VRINQDKQGNKRLFYECQLAILVSRCLACFACYLLIILRVQRKKGGKKNKGESSSSSPASLVQGKKKTLHNAVQNDTVWVFFINSG